MSLMRSIKEFAQKHYESVNSYDSKFTGNTLVVLSRNNMLTARHYDHLFILMN